MGGCCGGGKRPRAAIFPLTQRPIPPRTLLTWECSKEILGEDVGHPKGRLGEQGAEDAVGGNNGQCPTLLITLKSPRKIPFSVHFHKFYSSSANTFQTSPIISSPKIHDEYNPFIYADGPREGRTGGLHPHPLPSHLLDQYVVVTSEEA